MRDPTPSPTLIRTYEGNGQKYYGEERGGMNDQSEPGTVEALLAAGRALFAERGYEGASVRAITAHACANLGAITYHFGSKREFYDRVVEECVLPLVERVEALVRGDTPEASSAPSRLPALDRIELVVRGVYEHLRAHPELPRLMVRELAEGGGPPAAVVGPLRRLYQALVALVVEGQERGEIRGGDPLVLVVSIVAQPIHYGLVGPAFMRLTGQDPEDPAQRAEIVRSAVDFVRAGLAARVGGARRAAEVPGVVSRVGPEAEQAVRLEAEPGVRLETEQGVRPEAEPGVRSEVEEGVRLEAEPGVAEGDGC